MNSSQEFYDPVNILGTWEMFLDGNKLPESRNW